MPPRSGRKLRGSTTVCRAWRAWPRKVKELADFLDVPVKTVYQRRCHGYGPQAKKVGRFVRFDPEEVAAWFDGRSEEVT